MLVACGVESTLIATETPTDTDDPEPIAVGTLSFFAGALSFDDAEGVCQAHGGHLVSIHSDDDGDAVVAFVESVSTTSRVWIGGNDLVSEVCFPVSAALFLKTHIYRDFFHIGKFHAHLRAR